jgi:hypothetical protein
MSSLVDANALRSREQLSENALRHAQEMAVGLNRLPPEANLVVKIFAERYRKELNSYSRVDLPSAEERLRIYWEYVLKEVYENINDLSGARLFSQMSKFIKNMQKTIKTSVEYFDKPENQKFNAVICHGVITNEPILIPVGVILCILTPLNRYAAQSENEEIEILNILSTPEKRNEFLSNPCCYGKDTIGHLFEYATIYFEGQTFFDIELSLDTKTEIEKKYDGIYNNDNLNDYRINKTPKPNKSSFPSNIKQLLESVSGIIIIKCCRACDTYIEDYSIVQNLYRYEHFMKILNRTLSDEIYEKKCIDKKLYCSSSSAQYNKVKITSSHKKQLELPKILRNESIGISHSENIKIIDFFFPDDILNKIKHKINCFQEDDNDLDIFNMYDIINKKIPEILKLPNEQQIKCFEYFNNNVDLQHFKSYLFYKKEIKNEEIFFPNNRYTYQGIEKLYLRKCNIDNLTERMFLTIRSSSFYSPIIKELYLSHNNLTNIDFVFKGLLSFFYQLTKIDVSNNNILYLPSNLKNLVNLTDLNLKYNTNLLLGNSKTIKQIIEDPEFPKDIKEKIKAKERLGEILYIDIHLPQNLKILLLPYLDEKIQKDLEDASKVLTTLPYPQYSMTKNTINKNPQTHPTTTPTPVFVYGQGQPLNNPFGFGKFEPIYKSSQTGGYNKKIKHTKINYINRNKKNLNGNQKKYKTRKIKISNKS